ncbi:MAG TPA: hypothetical protein DCS46_21340, partial [Bradyrhizobium sp.]|nr:hypothetical protein [Bradyrhizobium sp.]
MRAGKTDIALRRNEPAERDHGSVLLRPLLLRRMTCGRGTRRRLNMGRGLDVRLWPGRLLRMCLGPRRRLRPRFGPCCLLRPRDGLRGRLGPRLFPAHFLGSLLLHGGMRSFRCGTRLDLGLGGGGRAPLLDRRLV